MKEKYIVLRNPRPGTRDPFLGARANVETVVASPSIKIEELERKDVPAMTNNADVFAVAPVIPMKLIAPVDGQETASPAAEEEIAWGVKAVGADTSPFSGDGIVVAVLDTGIDATHPAFAGVELIRKNFTDEAEEDLHGHGTHCAGTIFGRTTGGKRIGVAPGVKKALIGKVARLIGSTTLTGLQAGFDSLDIGAGLIRAPQE